MKGFPLLIVSLESFSEDVHAFHQLGHHLVNSQESLLMSHVSLVVTLNPKVDILHRSGDLRPDTLAVLKEVDVFSLHHLREALYVISVRLKLPIVLGKDDLILLIKEVNLVLHGFPLLFHFLNGLIKRGLGGLRLLVSKFDKLDHPSVLEPRPLNDFAKD